MSKLSKKLSMKNKPLKLKNLYFASCPTGLEQLLLKEIKQLDPQQAQAVKGGVEFTCLPEIALELLFCSRIASRVYKKIYQFEIKTEKDLYYFAKEIKWKAVFGLDQTFKISVVQSKSPNGEKRSQFSNTMFLGQKLKDAIVDRFRADCNDERPSVEKVHPNLSLQLHLAPNDNPHSRKEVATIMIDITGRPLSERGYKSGSFTAPLRENLAAGIIGLMEYHGEGIFIDAMCGSGTMLIEAALIAGDIPPCFYNLKHIERGDFWDFQNHFWFQKSEYLQNKLSEFITKYLELSERGYQNLQQKKIKLLGNDIDNEAMKISVENIRRARLLDYIEFENKDALFLETDETTGYVFANPPYGERLGRDEDLEHLYHEWGETLKHKFKGFKAYLFTGNLPLIKKISLRTSSKVILFNGNIESRLVEYQLY